MSESGFINLELMMEGFLKRITEEEGECLISHLSDYIHKNTEERTASLNALREQLT